MRAEADDTPIPIFLGKEMEEYTHSKFEFKQITSLFSEWDVNSVDPNENSNRGFLKICIKNN